MADASFSNSLKHAASKPRLSLLSSKQSSIKLNAEDQIDLRVNQNPSSSSNNDINFNNNNNVHNNKATNQIQTHILDEELKHQKHSNGKARTDDNKMNISKEDLIRLLSILKSELQSKEIALAAIKCEQLKRLINPVEISRSSLASTYMKLQDRLNAKDHNNNNNNKLQRSKKYYDELKSGTSNQDTKTSESSDIALNCQQSECDDTESLNMLNTLLELLDRHPLLALPRDSIYCLDYSCNETSTKNYLNVKIQHLDNLINQHRRFRFYMNERLKRSEQSYLDLTHKFEIERNLKFQEESQYRSSGKKILLKHIDQLKQALEKEKADKQTIVVTLLNDLLDERDKNSILTKKLNEICSNSSHQNHNLAKQESSELETVSKEVNSLNAQLREMTIVFEKQKSEMASRISELELENAKLKSQKEHSSIKKSVEHKIETKDSNQVSLPLNSNRSGIVTKQPFRYRLKQVT